MRRSASGGVSAILPCESSALLQSITVTGRDTIGCPANTHALLGANTEPDSRGPGSNADANIGTYTIGDSGAGADGPTDADADASASAWAVLRRGTAGGLPDVCGRDWLELALRASRSGACRVLAGTAQGAP